MLRAAAILGALILALVGGAELYHVASEPPAPMKPEDLARAVRQVGSLARETAFLCARIEEDRVTGPFARTHRDKLEEELRDQARELEEDLPPALEDAGGEARRLTAALATSLEELKRNLADPAELARIRAEATRIAADIGRLEPR